MLPLVASHGRNTQASIGFGIIHALSAREGSRTPSAPWGRLSRENIDEQEDQDATEAAASEAGGSFLKVLKSCSTVRSTSSARRLSHTGVGPPVVAAF